MSTRAVMRSSSYFSGGMNLDADVQGNSFKDQIAQVKAILSEEKLIHQSRIDLEVDWFYTRLGIDAEYFKSTPVPIIARHILSLYSAKMVSHATGHQLEVQMHNSSEGSATYITPSSPGQRDSPAMAVEQYIESYFLGEGITATAQAAQSKPQGFTFSQTIPVTHNSYRLACYRTTGTVSPDSQTQLRLYFLSTPEYPEGTVVPTDDTKLEAVGDVTFWARASDTTKKIYQEVLNLVAVNLGPVIRLKQSPGGARLVIGYKRGSTHSYWSAVCDLYHFYGMYSTHKYIEQFANGTVIYSIYLKTLTPLDEQELDRKVRTISEQASLSYVLPRTGLSSLLISHQLSVQEVTYAYVAWKFAYQFLNRYATEYAAIAQALGKDPAIQSMLAQLKTRLTKDTFTEGRVRDAVLQYPGLIKELYEDFEKHHLVSSAKDRKFDRTRGGDILSHIQKQTSNELDSQVFGAMLTFNRHILKTNFFKQSKVALSFRLDPGFLDVKEYTEVPFAVFFVVGSEFRGFHVRFRDIARGGIRIIRSHNVTIFDHNTASLFNENYNLAHTQQQKNKDIPEGGSKGTILLNLDHQNKAEVAFRKYIDALLDLMLPNDEVVDYYGKEEILFMGPDEGTAEFMDWASQHSRKRGYRFWKAFTTGKSPTVGGIPHDLHGMTTRSIHQYVLGTLAKLGLNEENISKFMTGGPDGDLGSNEVLISKDKTIAVVDGSGVLCDPEGIHREELTRLAKARIMTREFDRSKLSPRGFFVDVSANEIVLPNGDQVSSGLQFRNNFHLNKLSSADVFVPCGGRPEAVQLANVDQMFHANGEPRFKIVVEGANLFFTQKARLILEEKGVIIFKDASANKGGVTSSSLEVLAALALTDEEFSVHMMVQNNVTPKFHTDYVGDVHEFIEDNARQEFECIWREHQKQHTPRCILTEQLSQKINELNDSIQGSPLWDDLQLRKKVLSQACPKNLLALVGVDKLMERVPETYMRAIFGSYLASRFVYECGLSSPEFAFFTFIQKYVK